jgi:LPXTG-motif cell wall-anchored protein
MNARMRRFGSIVLVMVGMLGVAAGAHAGPDAAAGAPAATTARDGGVSLDKELRELDRTRQEFAGLARQLDEQRAELEAAKQRAEARQNLTFAAVGVGVLVLVAAGLVWLSRKRKKTLAERED